MDKLQLAGRNLGRVFNFRSGHLHAAHLQCFQVKLPNLRLKTQPKQLLGSLLLDITLSEPLYQMQFLISSRKFLIEMQSFFIPSNPLCLINERPALIHFQLKLKNQTKNMNNKLFRNKYSGFSQLNYPICGPTTKDHYNHNIRA